MKWPDAPPWIGHRTVVMQGQALESRYFSNRLLAPLIAWVNQHRGAKSELLRRLRQVTGRSIPRMELHRWLHPDPECRIEPSFGTGILLFRIMRSMRQEYVLAITPPGVTDPGAVEPDEEQVAQLISESDAAD